MTEKIRIYSLSVKYCKEIFDRKLFTLVEFKEDEFGENFDLELANIDAVSLHDNGVTIIGRNDEYFIPRNEFKEIIIIWVESL